MLPVLAIVGRPNVGKSTLFNRLTHTRDALVADEPGVTRDRQVGVARREQGDFLAVDTGGLAESGDPIIELIGRQAMRAVEEADVTVLVVDAREGLTDADRSVAGRLRRTGKPLVLAVNKIEGLDAQIACAEFHALGMPELCAISAGHGEGVAALVETAAAHFPPRQPPAAAEERDTRVAVAGRPNVGKSTLINRLLGDERVLVHDAPGTTRDSVHVPFERGGRRYTLVDTAGVRRRARIEARLEVLSVIKSLQAIEASNVVVFVIDAHEGVTEQDAHLLGLVLAAGRALVLAVNKWDRIPAEQRRAVREGLARRLSFIDFAATHYVSALHGSGVGGLLGSVDRAWQSASRDLATPELTRILAGAVHDHAPPLVRGRRIKLRYAHQGGRNPPLIVIHGTQAAAVPDSYRRYLARSFREALRLEGTPVRIELRSGGNPYAGRAATPGGRRRRGSPGSRRRGDRRR